MWSSACAISLGAAAGALTRWQLGIWLNSLFPAIPPGTLAAKVIGGYVIGFATAYFAQAADIAPEWRLLIVTGFCGALTTFSTFSAEVTSLLQQGRPATAMAAMAVHVTWSLAATLAGLASWELF